MIWPLTNSDFFSKYKINILSNNAKGILKTKRLRDQDNMREHA